jgi:3-deoxy-7-phosphoheptulonate synthase
MTEHGLELVTRDHKQTDTVIAVSPSVAIGNRDVCIIAGPCAVESESQIVELAHVLRAAGATILRGGAFKPRTSPYTFPGLGTKGLTSLRRAGDETGLPVVTEVMDVGSVEEVEEHADILQIGSRNMQNYPLLRRVGQCVKPVLLKRGIAATLWEWLSSAEYIANGGNLEIILCERGIRGFDPATRNLFDVTAVPAVKRLTHLPVIADPSHGTGDRTLVPPMALAAVAAGADAVMVEVHTHPDNALSDGPQSIEPAVFEELVKRLRLVASAVGRSVLQATKPVHSP